MDGIFGIVGIVMCLSVTPPPLCSQVHWIFQHPLWSQRIHPSPPIPLFKPHILQRMISQFTFLRCHRCTGWCAIPIERIVDDQATNPISVDPSTRLKPIKIVWCGTIRIWILGSWTLREMIGFNTGYNGFKENFCRNPSDSDYANGQGLVLH